MSDVIQTGAAPETAEEVRVRNALGQKARTVSEEYRAWERRFRRYVKYALGTGLDAAGVAALVAAAKGGKGDTPAARKFVGWYKRTAACERLAKGDAAEIVKAHTPRA